MKKNNLFLALTALLALTGCEKPVDPSESQSESEHESSSQQDSGSSSQQEQIKVRKLSDKKQANPSDWQDDGKTYSFNEYTTVSPSNWNELTYQDSNDTSIMSYIQSGFFTYDFSYDAQGEIEPGKFVTDFEAVSAIEDVTPDYAGNEKYDVPAEATDSYAYKLSFRQDLKWDDGTPIDASDFVYTMKQQLDPLFKNYRADSYYNGGTIIHNAKDYVYQGSTVTLPAEQVFGDYDSTKDDKYVFGMGPGEVECTIRSEVFGFPASYDTTKTINYLIGSGYLNATLADALKLEGKTLAQIKADTGMAATYQAYLDMLYNVLGGTEAEIALYCVAEGSFPELSFDEVGIFTTGKYDLVIVLDKPLGLMEWDEDGNATGLSYQAAYNFGSLPLVKKALYEKCKIAPATEGGLWTTDYNTSVEKTASWGPYKLTDYQVDKQFILERNEYWYGYTSGLAAGKYQTDRIVCTNVPNWNTAWLKFQAGEIDSIGIDVSIASDYKNGSRTLFTADDYVGSLQIQSSTKALEEANVAGEVNKSILTNVNFRNAMSLAINRAKFANDCTTASLAGFGIFNSMHYYDVAHGGVYRETDYARQTLCDVYGVDVEDYSSLEDAADSITGYNVTRARALVRQAVAEEVEAGHLTLDKDGKVVEKVKIAFGTGAITESSQRQFDAIKGFWVEMCKETPLEGKLDMTIEDHGSNWNKDFKAGSYEICMGGWSGAAWDPGYFLLAYLDKNYRYARDWDTTKVFLEFNPDEEQYNSDTMEAGDAYWDAEKGAFYMDLMTWYNCLNGMDDNYDWSETGDISTDGRLSIIAKLEAEVLKSYYTLPLYNYFSASMISYKCEYITRDYNTFLGYGGITYMTYNYDDAEWVEYVKTVNLTELYKA